MKTLISFAAIAAATVSLPTVAIAQAVPAATVAVVDLERVTSQCTACKTALTALQGQISSAPSAPDRACDPAGGRAEGDPGRDHRPQRRATRCGAHRPRQGVPDQAAAGRPGNVEPRAADPAQPGVHQPADLAEAGPIYQQVMQRRGANVMVERGAVLAAASAVDVTADVLTALNAALPSLATTAPAAPAQAQPQGR